MRIGRRSLAHHSLMRMGCALVLAASAACSRTVDLKNELKVVEVTTGWFDAGIVDGKNKLVPTVQFKLQNAGPESISSVQSNAVFRITGDNEELGAALAKPIGPEGLAAGAMTPAVVLRSQLGYTGDQPRAQLLQHSQFRDARVEVFAKHGSQQWVKIFEAPVTRQLLTR